MNRQFVVLAAALCWGLVLGRSAGAQTEKASAPKKPLSLTMKVIQTVESGELKTRIEYRGWCEEPAKCRLEGKLIVGDGLMEMDLQMVSEGEMLYQLAETPLGPQAFKYDLKRLKQVDPNIDPAGSFNPLTYKRTIEALPKVAEAKTEFLMGEEMAVHEVKVRTNLPATAIAGLPVPIEIDHMRIWMAKKDGLPRQVVAYDKADKAVMTTIFRDLQLVDDIPDEKFAFQAPEGVIVKDNTDMILVMVKEGAGDKE